VVPTGTGRKRTPDTGRPAPLTITKAGQDESRSSSRLRATPKRITKELHGIAHSFKQRAARDNRLPLRALVIEADDGDASGQWGEGSSGVSQWVTCGRIREIVSVVEGKLNRWLPDRAYETGLNGLRGAIDGKDHQIEPRLHVGIGVEFAN